MPSEADLQKFWRFLESRPRSIAVMQEWKDCADACFGAVEPLLQPRAETLFSFPSPRPQGGPMVVVRHGDGQVVAVDRDDPSHRLELTAECIVPYELHLPGLRQVICDALGLATARTQITPPARDVLLGAWEPQNAVRFSVRLLLAYGRQQLAELVRRRMVTDDKEGQILITPTRRLWQEQFENEARRRKVLLVPLSEALLITNDGFQATGAWEQYLRAFCQMVQATFPSNYLRERPRRKRAERTAKIERIKQALVDHFRAARDHAFSSAEQGDGAELLPRPSKTMLAKMAGVKPHDITRCFRDDPQLVRLYAMADNGRRRGAAPSRGGR
jgi:hypothetical protein